MAAEIHDADVWRSPEDDLLDAFLALDTPQGFKAEIIEGEITVTPPPDGDHEAVIGRIVRRVFKLSGEDITVAGNKGLIVPGGRYIPDLTFAEEGAFDAQPPWMRPKGVLMVAEVTSSNPARDREAKRQGYAAAGIPLYLLVDRRRNEVLLYSRPEDGDYGVTVAVSVGNPLLLPAPFGFELDTDRFA
ncbi:Uma2 family endonuclease [Kitasatospora sp. NA04385]|uniref:Uma2 family endonuclease n=1 Tax=Kitasatospora sp. NA04385 TaxID=2742135 RepID=UPI00158FF395|nr:Uma2 family endonuclease [Kitasatospora sp. NA04385]QKW21698.1 Uma2 family endonuclease [Kitasatospora sp. NA04385]